MERERENALKLQIELQSAKMENQNLKAEIFQKNVIIESKEQEIKKEKNKLEVNNFEAKSESSCDYFTWNSLVSRE